MKIEVCRQCARFKNHSGGRRSFVLPGAKPHYAPDLPFRLEHIALDVQVDPIQKTLKGNVQYRLKTLAPEQKRICLDQVGLKIESVKISGKNVAFTTEGNKLWVELIQSPSTDQIIELGIHYGVNDPRRGLYFTGPDEFYPKKPNQVWSQGQDEDNRFWFPSFDYPNQKATSEVKATVPRGYTAISNGALLSKKEDVQGSVFHYKIATPHVNYLITLVVGEFSHWRDTGPRGLPVEYYVQPGREEDGKRAFGDTPKMIEAFEKRIGVPYPYEKYSQVAVQDFIFGGMENTSATTQTDSVLHDARAALDFNADALVSHELAHQWFGDLITCRDWSHGWLNEGFATFFERVWLEEKKGAGGGPDEAKYYALQDLREHLDEDEGSYRRAIVCNTYLEPIDLFDTHLYHKGGLVLNLLRHELGAELFWKAIRFYLERHREQNVETLDLIRAIEDTTGRNLRRFFDEWVFAAGYPEFELSYQWQEEEKRAEVVIEQKQTGGRESITRDDATTHLFHVTATLQFTLSDGSIVEKKVSLGQVRDRVFIPLESKPLMVRFDPESAIPKTLNFPRSKELLLYQLEKDRDVLGRIEAAHELKKLVDGDVVAALAKSVKGDPFWGVQAEVASVLAEIRSDSARSALISAVAVPHPKARRAIVRALGTFRHPDAARTLRSLAQQDPSYFVEAEAISAWTSAVIPVGARSDDPQAAAAEAFLLQCLEKESFRQVIRDEALGALASLPGVARGERPLALQAIKEWLARGKPLDARLGAVRSLGTLLSGASVDVRMEILRSLSQATDEPSFRLRRGIVEALSHCESSDAIAILEKIHSLEPDGRVKRNATVVKDRIAAGASSSEAFMSLKGMVEKLEEEQKKLRSLLEEKAR